MSSTAIATFNTSAKAQAAIADLKEAGFTESDIGVAARKRDNEHDDLFPDEGDETKADEGAVAGATTGLVGGTLWGVGIAAGLLPAIGPVIAGGTLAAIVASGATAAAAGGLAGSLIGLGIAEDDANQYAADFDSGKTVVTVKAGDRIDLADTILQRHA